MDLENRLVNMVGEGEAGHIERAALTDMHDHVLNMTGGQLLANTGSPAGAPLRPRGASV